MQKEKGQIQVVLFILVIIAAFVLFFIYSKPTKKEIPEVSSPSKPVFQEETVISSSKEEEVQLSPDTVSDYYAPYRFNIQPSGNLSASTRATFISLETNEKAVCRYSDVSGVSYHSMNHVFSNTNSTSHYTQVTGLSEGQGYIYYIKCIDEYGNVNIDDIYVYFAVKEPDDFTPPVRSNQYPTGDVFSSRTSVTIGISTNESASCRYDTRQGVSYNSMNKSLADDGTKKYHTAIITNLIPGSSYSYFVRCKDLKENVNTGDVMISFSIE